MSFSSQYNLLVILGPTASGKTGLGVKLARHYQGEILSADSRQVFKGMDLGSGKDLEEYGEIAYHLINLVEPGSDYSVFHYQQDFFSAYQDICHRQKLPIMVGGTGLYIDAITQNFALKEVPINHTLRESLKELSLEQLQEKLLALKPEQHNNTDLIVRPRLVRAIEIALGEKEPVEPVSYAQIKPLILGIQWPRSELRARITERLKERFKQGMLEEVEALHQQGVSFERLEFFGLEYRLIAQHLKGELNYNDMFQKLNSQIHQFAKRQDTWFRKMQRRGDNIHWLDAHQDLMQQACTVIDQFSFESPEIL
ncbi:tRNA (adenosine(37)-N6)-dimethylallyltransferase MiaA [Celerinatantimonas sp. MCCC 1A17872]|uniref:tRNA (adenosine(37)-N6)-dimethylallyltransferase MiaA n=1 Tax=Celerinatantimonas sp. MCCC 1A17872 TaxID=3177514 RepID=UPI0038C61D1A